MCLFSFLLPSSRLPPLPLIPISNPSCSPPRFYFHFHTLKPKCDPNHHHKPTAPAGPSQASAAPATRLSQNRPARGRRRRRCCICLTGCGLGTFIFCVRIMRRGGMCSLSISLRPSLPPSLPRPLSLAPCRTVSFWDDVLTTEWCVWRVCVCVQGRR